MPDNNDELKNKVEKLERDIEDLKKKLEENTRQDKERDEQHHQELKALSEKNHKENLTWNKMGAIATPLMIALVPMILKWFEAKRDIRPAIKKDADDINDKLTELLKELKNNKKEKE